MKALNTVQPYDWAEFFRARVYEVDPKVPENGFTQGGYRLVYNDQEPEWLKKEDSLVQRASRLLWASRLSRMAA